MKGWSSTSAKPKQPWHYCFYVAEAYTCQLATKANLSTWCPSSISWTKRCYYLLFFGGVFFVVRKMQKNAYCCRLTIVDLPWSINFQTLFRQTKSSVTSKQKTIKLFKLPSTKKQKKNVIYTQARCRGVIMPRASYRLLVY